MAREMDQSPQEQTANFQESELKICDLCGWLNLAVNSECFVCGWHGHFEEDPKLVRAAFELNVRRYGKLELHHLTDIRTHRATTTIPIKTRMHLWWKRLRTRFHR